MARMGAPGATFQFSFDPSPAVTQCVDLDRDGLLDILYVDSINHSLHAMMNRSH